MISGTIRGSKKLTNNFLGRQPKNKNKKVIPMLLKYFAVIINFSRKCPGAQVYDVDSMELSHCSQIRLGLHMFLRYDVNLYFS